MKNFSKINRALVAKKKFFLFAAALIAAMTVNAKVLDLTTAGTAIGDWTLGAQASVNTSKTDEAKAKYVYDISGGEEANETFITAEPNFVFQTKNTAKKEGAFSIYPAKCFEYGGKNGILVLKGTKAGDKIILFVAAKGGTAANFKDAEGTFPKNASPVSTDLTLPAKDKNKANTEGYDSEGYAWKELEFVSLGGDVQIKEFDGGYRISKIQVGDSQGVDNINADVKATKVFENGQLVIIKNGVRYNALGAAL